MVQMAVHQWALFVRSWQAVLNDGTSFEMETFVQGGR